MNDPQITPMSSTMPKFGPPERMPEMPSRLYIPVPGGWEVQTKGQGSTFRIADPKGRQYPVSDQPYLFERLTNMALDINDAHSKALAENAAFRKALELYADRDSWRLNGVCDPNSANFQGMTIAAVALASYPALSPSSGNESMGEM